MSLFWARAWNAVAVVVFPTPCVSCGALIQPDDPPLCSSCWDRLPPVAEPVCACGAPLPREEEAGACCSRCRRGLSGVESGASLGLYAGPLRDCVVALKYQGRYRTAERLARRISDHAGCRSILSGAEVLVPVPLYPARERERGFNQAGLLAEALARRIRADRVNALRRTRPTRSQTDLSARARRLNVREAFAPAPGAGIAGRIVVLIDDVTTTGATIRECSAVLRAMGAAEVRCITAARAE